MLKIVRGLGPVYGNAEPVLIDNRVFIPTEDEETGEVISPEEQRRREDEERAERERRIQEEVDARVAHILDDRSAALERERIKIIESAKREANEITADAKATTMAVIDKANNECVKIKEIARQEGQREGFAEGKAEGRAEALDKYKKYIDAAGTLLSEINARKEAYYIANEDELRDTVFDVAKKVVHAELKVAPEDIDSIIADAAKNFRNSDYIKIILSEEDMTERFKTDEKLINKIIPFISDIEIVFDNDAEEGTIVLDNGSEIVDASIPTQLDFLKEILNNTRGEMSEGDAEFAADMTNEVEQDIGGIAEIPEISEIPENTAEIPAVEAAAEPEHEVTLEELAIDEPFADVLSDIMAESAAAENTAAANTAAEEIPETVKAEEAPEAQKPEEAVEQIGFDGFADNSADDFVSAVSEAVPEAETAETKKGTKKRAKKSEE